MIFPIYNSLAPLTLSRNFGVSEDPDAAAYLNAVEAADGQALESAVRVAVNDFVVGCKSDGIWSAIKASCILVGARTLSGALVPLAGTAPTNFNFVSGDFDRKTGLKGNGTTKYLGSNRNNNEDPLNSKHIYARVTTAQSSSTVNSNYIGSTATNGFSHIRYAANTSWTFRANGAAQVGGASLGVGGYGCNRANSTQHSQLEAGNLSTFARNSTGPSVGLLMIFARSDSFEKSDARIAFYSIGESLNLLQLDSRLSNLMTALAAAIP